MCRYWEVVEDESGQSYEYCRRRGQQCSCSGLKRECPTRSYKKILTAVILSCLLLSSKAEAQAQPPIWQVIMAEAVSDGYNGMYAVACVIRNRGGDLHGFCGAKRKDLPIFCTRQGGKAMREARQIERIVFAERGHDVTNGATHFEAVERYGLPRWAKGMKVVARIGEHTFFKK